MFGRSVLTACGRILFLQVVEFGMAKNVATLLGGVPIHNSQHQIHGVFAHGDVCLGFPDMRPSVRSVFLASVPKHRCRMSDVKSAEGSPKPKAQPLGQTRRCAGIGYEEDNWLLLSGHL
ncbi:hypothetical protein GGS21DRAFT_514084 [Xylaria nigripes]|nr:hypothetical protein GGS21DRAFT_514084 [Xylaria nigripes]